MLPHDRADVIAMLVDPKQEKATRMLAQKPNKNGSQRGIAERDKSLDYQPSALLL